MRDRILKKTESLLYHRVVVLQSELRVAYSNMLSLLFNIPGSASFNENIAIKWLDNSVVPMGVCDRVDFH